MLEKIARWSYHRRWWMLLIWIIALFGFSYLQGAAGADYSSDFSLPGAESQDAFDLLNERFPEQAGETVQIVFKADDGVDDPEVRSTMEDLFAQIAELDRVIGIEPPYSEQAQGQIAPDGRTAFATVHFTAIEGEVVPQEIGTEIIDLSDEAETDALAIEPGGNVIAFSEFEQPGAAEGIGILFAMVILLIAFGSVLAMGLPIGVAIFGIAIGLSLVMLFANFLNVPEFTPQLASMIGIGVGIDYALFIVTRYRQQIHHGLDPEQATMVAITTAGKAVLFAGTTVVISLLGILLMGFAFVEGLAVGGAATVAVTMIASVTLLPALLGFVGGTIDRWRIPLFTQDETKFKETAAYRWSRVIQHRAWPAAIAGLVVLVVLSIPLFSIRLGFADAGSASTERSSRRAYDLISEGFGPGFNGPLLLATEVDSPADVAELEAVGQSLTDSGRVAAVTPALPNED